jgi:hypothetical protein
MASSTTANSSNPANKALMIGIVGIVLTIPGIWVSGGAKLAFAWLTAMTFWTGMAIGMLMLIMIHHIVDASWSTVIRRQFEHGISAFKWLALMFVPLAVASIIEPSILWKYLDPSYDLANVGGHGTVGSDVLWQKKSGLLSLEFFLGLTVVSFLGWILLSNRFRRCSFSQDNDGDIIWTRKSRFWSAVGLPFMAITLSLCVILWVKALDYHWFSTMFGVWYFAECVRGALAIGILIMCYLTTRGDYQGVLNKNHWYSIGMLSFAFTVFWAYVTFSQYFLIWNANIPEETFWYNIREIQNSTGEPNQWKWVGMLLLFGHFFVPFFGLISYPAKVSKKWMKIMASWIIFIILIDIIYNVWPSKKDALGDPVAFAGVHMIWTLTAVVGVGGICAWSYFKSLPTAKLIPTRDPRIGESLTYHE